MALQLAALAAAVLMDKQECAGTADARAVRPHSGVLFGELVASLAVRLRPLVGTSLATCDVLCVGNRLQVVWRHAVAHTAGVIDDQACWYRPIVQLVRDSVSLRRPLGHLEAGVALGAHRAEPQHAALLVRQGNLGPEATLVAF